MWRLYVLLHERNFQGRRRPRDFIAPPARSRKRRWNWGFGSGQSDGKLARFYEQTSARAIEIEIIQSSADIYLSTLSPCGPRTRGGNVTPKGWLYISCEIFFRSHVGRDSKGTWLKWLNSMIATKGPPAPVGLYGMESAVQAPCHRAGWENCGNSAWLRSGDTLRISARHGRIASSAGHAPSCTPAGS